MKRLLLLALLPVLAFGHDLEIHSKHWLFGLPQGTDDTNDLIIRDAYALSNNDETKFADWVAYKLTPEETFGDLGLSRPFHEDPFLDESETLEEEDYVGSFNAQGYHKGHQAPLGSFKGSHIANQTNALSNITPQLGALNSGRWVQLESAVRRRVREFQEVWVLTGPLFESAMPDLVNADEPHTVPSGYWKIVYIRQGNGIRAGAFIMEQAISGSLADQITTIEDIESRSGLTFFSELSSPGTLKLIEDADWVIQ
jgi:endonuclease G